MIREIFKDQNKRNMIWSDVAALDGLSDGL